jgi:hypothetical protein
MIFELHGQFIEDTAVARATRTGSSLVVAMETDARRAANLTRAIRIACAHVGPLMERGDRAGEGWGLLVVAGPASVAYGNWPAGPPRRPGPELEALRRILAEYRPGDGARAALHNSTKVIEAYADLTSQAAQRAA